MKFEQDHCPECGEELRGTCDTIPGCAVMSRQENGSYEYVGETDVFWDGQMSEKDEEGKVRVQCRGGHDWWTKARE